MIRLAPTTMLTALGTLAFCVVAVGQESSWAPDRDKQLRPDQQALHLANSQIHLSPIELTGHTHLALDDTTLTTEIAPSHQVLRAPGENVSGSSSHGSKFGLPKWKSKHQNSPNEHLPAPPLHGAHHKLRPKHWIHGPTQPKSAMIPYAKENSVWKQPYSYGYFGASRTRQWTKNYGYRDRKTEWRYR